MKLTHEELVEIIWSHTDAVNGRVEGIDEAAKAIIDYEEAAQPKRAADGLTPADVDDQVLDWILE